MRADRGESPVRAGEAHHADLARLFVAQRHVNRFAVAPQAEQRPVPARRAGRLQRARLQASRRRAATGDAAAPSAPLRHQFGDRVISASLTPAASRRAETR